MKHLFVGIILSSPIFVLAQSPGPYAHEFKTRQSVLLYSYTQKHDSCFIYGYLKERKTERPVLNINITVKGFPVGTVPDREGNFRLFLPWKTGVLVFDKPGDVYFEFPYEYKQQPLKRPSAHH